MSHLRTKSST